MECGCCFGDIDVEQMVQCGDGHLFCIDCMKRYAEEAIHGQGKVTTLFVARLPTGLGLEGLSVAGVTKTCIII